MTAVLESQTREIEVELPMNAPRDVVWRALTEPGELVRWFPLHARVTPGVGGTIWTAWTGEEDWVESIEIWDPPRRLRTLRTRAPFSDALLERARAVQQSSGAAHRAAGSGPAATPESIGDAVAEPAAASPESAAVRIATDYWLEGRGGGTVLRLVHSGFQRSAEWDDEFDATRRGWGFELRGLRHYLERHRGSDRDVAWVRVQIAGDATAACARLLGREGLCAEGGVRGLAEGDAYDIRTVAGERLRGRVLVNGSRDFAATVSDLNDALLRVKTEDFAGQREASMWLSAYGVERDTLRRFEERCEGILLALFPEARALPHVSIRAR
jgi:hypothetical protein